MIFLDYNICYSYNLFSLISPTCSPLSHPPLSVFANAHNHTLKLSLSSPWLPLILIPFILFFIVLFIILYLLFITFHHHHVSA